MNTVVMYDSQFGNTERIAQCIAETLQAYGTSRAVRVDPALSVDSSGIDLLILGCPTQAFGSTGAMKSLLAQIVPDALRGVAVACFDTRIHGPWGSAARSIAKQLQKKGVEIIEPPQSFFVEGKEGPLESEALDVAVKWAKTLQEKVANHVSALR